MPYIKIIGVPLKCSKCGVSRVAIGMGQNSSLRSRLDGETPEIVYDDKCPDCGDRMSVDEKLKNL